LDEPGCRTNQPRHTQALSVIETILRAYLDGSDSSLLTQRYPYAAGFIARTWQALGPVNALTDVQMLMLERLLLLSSGLPSVRIAPNRKSWLIV
jgi:hypothetical protein